MTAFQGLNNVLYYVKKMRHHNIPHCQLKKMELQTLE